MPRENDVTHLHPLFRERSRDLEARARSAALPIARYESWRAPERQCDLWAFGRVSGVGAPGRHKTFERAWESAHQWGFAEDWVWLRAGVWSWDPPPGRSWDDFFRLVAAAGLLHLNFEKPHVQLPGFSARAVLAGGPGAELPSGDTSWEQNLERAVVAWGPLPRKDRYGVMQPGCPNVLDERPAALPPAGMVYDEERGLCVPDDALA